MIITHPWIIWWRAVFGFVMICAIIYGLVTYGWGYFTRDLEHYGSQTYPHQQHNTTTIVNYSNISPSTTDNTTSDFSGGVK